MKKKTYTVLYIQDILESFFFKVWVKKKKGKNSKEEEKRKKSCRLNKPGWNLLIRPDINK